MSKNAASQTKADLHMMGHRLDGQLASGNNSSVDHETAKRMMLIKKSKSSLIVPLLMPYRPGYDQAEHSLREQIDFRDDVPQFKVVGSLELYRFHYQPFDEDSERRIGQFATILSNEILPVYFQLRQTQVQIEQLQRQLVANTQPQNSLSRLLRQVYFNAPSQLNAAQILPLIIEPKSQTAFFYHFRDNHIYNFEYANTFIGEIVDFKCILELAAAEEDQSLPSSRSLTTDQDFEEMDQHESVCTLIPSHRKRALTQGNIKSVTNEAFKHILYYPVVGGPLGKIKAVVEVSFGSLRQVPKNVLTPQIQSFLESFSSKLTELETKLRTFCKFTESVISKHDAVRISKMFARWKTHVAFENKQEQFNTTQKATI